jgi:N-acetyl sugar amidotransferase
MNFQRCTRCAMDTTDTAISFNEDGVCNHCRLFDRLAAEYVFGGAEGSAKLGEIVARIKRDGTGKPYDCIMGVSGGVDSTYAVYLAKQAGLRPLAVHLDNGWDSELAVKNIEKTLRMLDVDLHTVVLDWEEFRDLQLAFLKSSTPDSEIPTDHAIISVMYSEAARYGLRHVVTGFNVRTESHMTPAWSAGHSDWRYIRAVQSRFGTVKLRTFPHMPLLRMLLYRRTQEWTHILNYVGYDKQAAKRLLVEKLGWVDYGGKHYESVYTRFYQGYILPKKFGFDKRKAHLSSLICSRQITRDEALHELATPPYPIDQQEADREYVIKKLQIIEADFEAIMAAPPKRFADYPSYDQIYKGRAYGALRRIYRAIRKRSPRG